jgi:hypothetical protein
VAALVVLILVVGTTAENKVGLDRVTSPVLVGGDVLVTGGRSKAWREPLRRQLMTT